MDRNIALWIAYDGTDFHGWQRQPGQRTVQEVLEQALRRVTRHPINLEGSGRTDAGVHAAGQVAHFRTTHDLPVDRLAHAIGSRLPGDVSIVSLREVHPSFHSRAGSLSKLYRYRIHNARHRPVNRLAQRYTHHVWRALDVRRMSQAARHFVGEHDFTAVAANTARKVSTVRTVLRCTVWRHLDEIRIDVEGTGFLYNQVRAMTGTLLDVGAGRFDPDDVVTILESRDRANAGPTAPASGLCLRWVRYPSYLLKPPPADDAQGADPGTIADARRDETL